MKHCSTRKFSLVHSYKICGKKKITGKLKVCWYHTLNLSLGNIMVYGSTPYVGMTPKENDGHNKSAQMTPLNLSTLD